MCLLLVATERLAMGRSVIARGDEALRGRHLQCDAGRLGGHDRAASGRIEHVRI